MWGVLGHLPLLPVSILECFFTSSDLWFKACCDNSRHMDLGHRAGCPWQLTASLGPPSLHL